MRNTKLEDHNKVLREMSTVIEDATNILENFGLDTQLQENETTDRISHLEVVFTTVFEGL